MHDSSDECCAFSQSCPGFRVILEVLPVSAWVLSGVLRLPPTAQRHAVSAARLVGDSKLTLVRIVSCLCVSTGIGSSCIPELDKWKNG